jgi:replicative superfamily II helicase
MNRQSLHVKNGQAVTVKEGLKRGHRKVKDVLVVNGVELALIDEIHHIDRLRSATLRKLMA